METFSEAIDPRKEFVDGKHIWRDGTCLVCGFPTFETGSWNGIPDKPAVSEGVGELETVTEPYRQFFDYFLWCSNPYCEKHVGELMFDTECPPAWANHFKIVSGEPFFDEQGEFIGIGVRNPLAIPVKDSFCTRGTVICFASESVHAGETVTWNDATGKLGISGPKILPCKWKTDGEAGSLVEVQIGRGDRPDLVFEVGKL